MKHQPRMGTIVALVAAIAALLSGCEKEKKTSPVIVVVGESTLDLEELRRSIPEAMRGEIKKADLEEFVTRWINSQVLYQKGRQLGLDKSAVIRRRVQDFEVRLIGSAYLDSTLETKMAISDREIKKYYDENQDIFLREKEEIHLKQVLLPDKKTADRVWRLLNRKASFDSLAKTYNIGQRSSETDLGYLSEDEVVRSVWKKVRIYRVGAITRPIQTDFGFHIFRILDKKPEGSIKELADVRDEIEARLRQDKLEENYLALMSQLKSTMKIETYFDLLNRIPLDSIVTKRSDKLARSH